LGGYISNSFSINELIKYESSGSTGVKSTVYMDKIEQANMRAILLNWWEWNGYIIGDPVFQTGMAEKRGLFKKLKDVIFNTHYMVAFDSREKVILKHLRDCESQKEMLLFGYASSLFEIARVAEKNGVKNKFRIAMSQGDKLFSHYEKQIINAFGCKVVEDYGLNEGFMVGQKVDLPYFYIYTPSTYIEILDEHDLPVPDGQIGRIVLTKLDGYAMPLIRYDSGDLGVILPKEEYPSVRKYKFPLLKSVIGRNTDVVQTSTGNQMSVHTFTGIFEYYEEIRQFQVEVLAIDSFRVKYIASDVFNSKILIEIENKIKELTRDELTFEWELVEKINPSKSGKPQILINNLIQNSLSDQS
jgi:phenylacetate-CoA ligase